MEHLHVCTMISKRDLRQMSTNNWNTMMVDCSDLNWQQHFCKTSFTSLATVGQVTMYQLVPRDCIYTAPTYISSLALLQQWPHWETHNYYGMDYIILHLISQVTPVLLTCPLKLIFNSKNTWQTYMDQLKVDKTSIFTRWACGLELLTTIAWTGLLN